MGTHDQGRAGRDTVGGPDPLAHRGRPGARHHGHEAHSGHHGRTWGRRPHSGHGGHGGHSHGVSADADRRWLGIALTLIAGFMAAEVGVGIAAKSLALVSDATHMLTDAVSIVLALIAMRLAARPARGGYTYGLKRAEILSAQANGLSLLLLGCWLAYEALRRLVTPPDVQGGLVAGTALAGVAVNMAAAWCISRANRTSLNVEGAFQHILNDLFAFLGTAAAGLIVLLTGFARADAVATLVVVALMVRSGVALVRESGRIFLEAAPAGMVPGEVGDRLVAHPDVTEVHDLHIWTITSGQAALSAHVLVAPDGDCHSVRRDLEDLLRAEYGLTHTTLQVDHAPAELLTVSASDPGPALGAHCAQPRGITRGEVHRR